MNIKNILHEIERTNPEQLEQATERRSLLKNWGSKLAMTAAPLVAASLFNKAQAKTTDILAEAMVFVLRIETMQVAFYKMAKAKAGLIPEPDASHFDKIIWDKDAHIAFWKAELVRSNNYLPPTPQYDFTGNGALPEVFNDYATFLTLAHAMEDVCVRMYLTSIKNLVNNKAYRSDAINMMTNNARNAAHIRLLRRNAEVVDIMPWITGTEAYSIVGEIQMAYQEEDNVIQEKSNVIGINGFDVTFETATQAFDEPMKDALADRFMAKFVKL